MAVKFIYSSEWGLQIKAEDGDELTEQQAMILAVQDVASGMDNLAKAVWNFDEEFVGKDFYKTD